MKNYYVVSAEWSDTKFDKPVEGTVGIDGPYGYEEARNIWQGFAQSNVDNCLHRAFISREIDGVLTAGNYTHSL